MSYIIIGLGNPGSEYENTRHNAGRMELLAFAKANDFSEWEFDKKLKALVSKGKLTTNNIQLVLPETFMNKSGEALKNLQLTTHNLQQGKKKIKEITNLVVVHDDLDIPFGKFKISFNKSSGGHRGVESIIKTIKTQAFVRIRVGICPHSSFPKACPPIGRRGGAGGGGFKLKKPHGEDLINKFILAKFKPDELVELKKLAKRISEGLVCLVTEGREKAMSQYHS